MIARFGAILILFYALGFVLFAFTLGKPAPATTPATDAAVVLTGGPGRIEHAIDVVGSRTDVARFEAVVEQRGE